MHFDYALNRRISTGLLDQLRPHQLMGTIDYGKTTEKGKAHVVDHHRHSIRVVADRRFRFRDKFQNPPNWQRRSHAARDRDHPHCIKSNGCDLAPVH